MDRSTFDALVAVLKFVGDDECCNSQPGLGADHEDPATREYFARAYAAAEIVDQWLSTVTVSD